MYSAIKIKINKSKSWLINKFTKQKKKLQPNFTFKPFQFSSIAKFIEYPNPQKVLQFEFRNRFWHDLKDMGFTKFWSITYTRIWKFYKITKLLSKDEFSHCVWSISASTFHARNIKENIYTQMTSWNIKARKSSI